MLVFPNRNNTYDDLDTFINAYDENLHLAAVERGYNAAIMESDPLLAIKAALRALVNDSTLQNNVSRFQAAVHGASLRLQPEYPSVALELSNVHDYVGLYLCYALDNKHIRATFPGAEYIHSTIALWDLIGEEERRAASLGIS